MSIPTIDEAVSDESEIESIVDRATNGSDGDDPCPKCGTDRDPKYPMCKQCGFYETLNTYVEVDEIDLENGIGPEEEPFVFPNWGKILIVVALLVVIESLVPIFVYPINSYQRTLWSLVQLGIGLVIAIIAHGRATFISTMENADSEIGDCLMHPSKIWMPMLGELPKTLPWVGSFVAGTLAVIMSLFVIRSIPYEKMFESDQPTKKVANPVIGMVATAAQSMPKKEMTMDEAMDQFKNLAVGNMKGIDDEDRPKVRETLECLVVGYYATDGNGGQNLSSLLVAGIFNHQLKLMGSVREGMDGQMINFLERQLPGIERERPFVDSTKNAKWVDPCLLVNVSFILQAPGDYRELKFEGLAGTTTLEEQVEKRERRRKQRSIERKKAEDRESALHEEDGVGPLGDGIPYGPFDAEFGSGLDALSF